MGIISKLFGKKMSKQEVRSYAQQAQRQLEIYDDSQEIFQVTKRPDVFFDRFDLAVKCLNGLEAIIEETNNAINYTGDDIPTKIKILEDGKENMTSLFIERYFNVSKEKALNLKTEKGRLNNASKSYDEIMEYSERLTKEQVERIEMLWSAIK